MFECVLTCLLSDGDCRSFGPVQQLSIHTDLILRVGLQVVETVSAGSSAQLRLLFLTICRKNTNSVSLLVTIFALSPDLYRGETFRLDIIGQNQRRNKIVSAPAAPGVNEMFFKPGVLSKKPYYDYK